jgi:hypothetical protein
MPIEFLHGRPLSREDLEMIHRQIEEGSEVIAAVDDEIRGTLATGPPCWRSFHSKRIDVARKPQPPSQPATWTVYRAAKKAVRLGEVEAIDGGEAIEKTVEKFKQSATMLIAMRRL